MGEKIVVGPLLKGLQNGVDPYYVDNDSFPTMINAYSWRGTVKRRRGTSPLTRAQRYFSSASTSYNPAGTTVSLVAAAGNIITGWSLSGSIIPSSVTLTVTAGAVDGTYTDDGAGALSSGGGGTGTINYGSGAITITGGTTSTVAAVFRYYPSYPILGLPSFSRSGAADSFPTTLAFDTKKSYKIETTDPYQAYDVSFYKNPALDGTNLPSYVVKTDPTTVSWTGEDYQLFWGASYQNALFATNGVTIPFNPSNIGMQYKSVTNIATITAGPPASAVFTITGHGLSIGDYLFFNEFSTASITGLNLQTGYVTAVPTSGTVTVTFPNATLGGAGGVVEGIAQYLTRTSDSTKSCTRFYDGDPTNGSVTTPVLNGTKGWVNYCPPLSIANYSIGSLAQDQYYLVGAKMILPFKDRLLFIGPVIQTSTAGSQQYLKDTIIYTQNGTPFYTCSFTATDVLASDTVFHPLLTPAASSSTQFLGATATACIEDETGYGGFVQSGINETIRTAGLNQDLLILGMETTKSKLIYTGNDILPFQFYFINSEFGDSSTFAALPLDTGIISKGTYGFLLTSSTDSERVDLQIPDEVFQTKLTNNGQARVIAQRDFINEWIYFSYPSNLLNVKYPTKTLQYNYREKSWAIFNETYTAYGEFKRRTGFTWLTIGKKFPTWKRWNEPWNAGGSTALQPEVLAGTQQGFIVARDSGTNEAPGLQIESISGSTLTSTDHCLATGDYVAISGAIGTISSELNGNIFRVLRVNDNTFTINKTLTAATYFGGGLIAKLFQPFIQTKAFPVAWGMGRKTRLGPQQYLFTRTDSGQVQVLIYLSMNTSGAYNTGSIVPDPTSTNNSLIYDNILHTSAEGTNLGLTAPNVNLNLLSGARSSQLWHRLSTSLIGDVVQLGITMSDSQMQDPTKQYQEIELHGFILDVSSASLLA